MVMIAPRLKKLRFPVLTSILLVVVCIALLGMHPSALIGTLLNPFVSRTTPANSSKLPTSASAGAHKFCDPRGTTDNSVCIFDVGLNTGQDTRLYLDSAEDTRVVAVEADPTLVDAARKKFGEAVTTGRLQLVNIGLVGNETTSPGDERPKLEFWVNVQNSKFSSFRQAAGCRSPRGDFLDPSDTRFCRRTEMETMSCSELIAVYGTPTYMKIDIEGMDLLCFSALANVDVTERPRYVSKENAFPDDVRLGMSMGYSKFKVVNQALLQRGLRGEEEGHSGPWGEEAEDIWVGREWHTGEQLLERLPVPKSVVIDGVERKGWYDLHASK